jgi:hypothetical protein
MRSLRRVLSKDVVVVALTWIASGCASGVISADAVPAEEGHRAVFILPSRIQRIVVARVPSGTDLLEGLQEAVRKEGLRNAAILSGAGSLTSYHVHSVGNTTLPAKNVYTRGDGPWDLLTVTGYVIDGRIHAHVTIVDAQKAFGGHLEPGTRVFTFAIVTLAELEEGVSLARFDDSRWNGDPGMRSQK